ncbi:hypothetical protein [Deinococcus radiotolerans]|uniref:ABC transmembrane type-1 domain-containing protein n=1 Tax=Deinococcus radiotolerans TaxID=1309407 RepID=A0ABQ2FNV4_9DEIO|nr:hypothetical protein [Deinococcus radiotolerans]GGL12367.1 hypothetical protein GCM10010844_33810 [Deinococcus radiotolerans]
MPARLALLVAVHAALWLGLNRALPWPERLTAYGAALRGALEPGVWTDVAPAALLTGTYLLLGTLLAWALVGGLRRVPLPTLWVLEALPPFGLLIGALALGLTVTTARGWSLPLTPWAPLMLALFALTLALPAAARAATQGCGAFRDAWQAPYTRAARAMGVLEARLAGRAWAVARPVAARSLTGDTLNIVLSLTVLEGLLQFPGVGTAVYGAVQATLSGTSSLLDGSALAAALAALLALGGVVGAAQQTVASRLDPRPAPDAA